MKQKHKLAAEETNNSQKWVGGDLGFPRPWNWRVWVANQTCVAFPGKQQEDPCYVMVT